MKGFKMTQVLMMFLLIGTVAMGIPITIVSAKYQIKWYKAICTTVILTLVGTLGTKLMFFIENQARGGLSFYGAVFLVPIMFLAIAPILRIPYEKIMDLCAIGECIMLALMKVHCIISGCCVGRVLFVAADGTKVLFPSREAELLVAIVLFAILLSWALKKKYCGQLYAWYFVLYGSTRFVLNIFREAWATKQMLLPFGNIWSIVAVVIGIVWLSVDRKRTSKCGHE